VVRGENCGTAAAGFFAACAVLPYDKAALDEMALRTRNAYYRIVGQKGATFYGIASALVRVVRSILRDQNTVLTVGSQMPGLLGLGDVTMSFPTL